MADYYSILKKTIASLPESNGAARRSVYSRARNAIVNQLKAYEPPLSPSEITSEQLRLEEAIRKVEAEAARESLGLSPAAPKVDVPVDPPVASREAGVEPQQPPEPSREAENVDETTGEVEQATSAGQQIPSPLKETLSEAETLGTAANQAVRNVKEAADPDASQSSGSDEASRREPVFTTAAAADDDLYASGSEQVPPVANGPEAGASGGRSAEKRDRSKRHRSSASAALRDGGSSSRILPIAVAGILALAIVGTAAYFLLPADEMIATDQTTEDEAGTRSASLAEDAGPEAESESPVEEETPAAADTSKNTDRLLDDGEGNVVAPDARTVTTTTINPAETGITAPPSSVVTNIEESPADDPVETPPAGTAQPAPDGQTPSAVPEGNLAFVAPEEPSISGTASGVETGVQRSILYEEGEDAGGAGTAAQGAVVWDVDEETDLDGKSTAILNASIEIPERDVKVDVRIKPNDDTSLSASHLVEIKYDFPENFAAGDVVNVPGLVMKPTEEALGDALFGASVKVSPGFFWIALSNLPNEQQHNLALLRERGWIDIPMLYENGKRGILTLEKGRAGTDAVEKAISAWQAG